MKKSHPLDSTLGRKIRTLRILKGMTQTEVGRRMGVAFQQIQKYENGSNRISALQLHDLALILEVSVAEFYVGLGTAATVGSADPLTLRHTETARHLERIADPRLRHALHLVVRRLADLR